MLTKRKLIHERETSLGVVLGSFLVHLAEEERAAWMLNVNCVVAVCVLCLFLVVPWGGLHAFYDCGICWLYFDGKHIISSMHAYKHVIHQVIGHVCEVFESELIFKHFHPKCTACIFNYKLSVHLKKNATSDQGSQFHICISPFVHFILHAN